MTGYYISGPMTGITHFNYPAFFEAERLLHEGNPFGTIFNPARADCDRVGWAPGRTVDVYGAESAALAVAANDKATRRDMLGVDLAWIIEHADVIVVLDGWEKSTGAQAEVAAGRAVGAQIMRFAGNTLVNVNIGSVWATNTWPLVDTNVLVQPDNRTVTKPEIGPLLLSDLARMKADVKSEEVRTTSASGGQKGAKLAAFDQISPEVLTLVAEHFGLGARKYAPHNFRKQYPWSLSFSALMRHAWAAWGGEDYDSHKLDCPPDCVDHTGSLHWIAAIWHAMNLAELTLHKDQHPEYDDRFTYPEVEYAPDFDGETEEA